jgi:hypothetical protein
VTRKSAIGAAFFVIASALGLSLPGHATSLCDLRPATSWYTTISAGNYRLLFDDDADLAATPQIQHARHGNVFVTNTDAFRIAGPSGTCWASPEVGIVTMPVFIGNGRYLYIPTYSGGDAYLFVVDAATCKTIWQSPDMEGGDATRTPDGFLLPGMGQVVVEPDCLPRLKAR